MYSDHKGSLWSLGVDLGDTNVWCGKGWGPKAKSLLQLHINNLCFFSCLCVVLSNILFGEKESSAKQRV